MDLITVVALSSTWMDDKDQCCLKNQMFVNMWRKRCYIITHFIMTLAVST